MSIAATPAMEISRRMPISFRDGVTPTVCRSETHPIEEEREGSKSRPAFEAWVSDRLAAGLADQRRIASQVHDPRGGSVGVSANEQRLSQPAEPDRPREAEQV